MTDKFPTGSVTSTRGPSTVGLDHHKLPLGLDPGTLTPDVSTSDPDSHVSPEDHMSLHVGKGTAPWDDPWGVFLVSPSPSMPVQCGTRVRRRVEEVGLSTPCPLSVPVSLGSSVGVGFSLCASRRSPTSPAGRGTFVGLTPSRSLFHTYLPVVHDFRQ